MMLPSWLYHRAGQPLLCEDAKSYEDAWEAGFRDSPGAASQVLEEEATTTDDRRRRRKPEEGITPPGEEVKP